MISLADMKKSASKKMGERGRSGLKRTHGETEHNPSFDLLNETRVFSSQ